MYAYRFDTNKFKLWLVEETKKFGIVIPKDHVEIFTNWFNGKLEEVDKFNPGEDIVTDEGRYDFLSGEELSVLLSYQYSTRVIKVGLQYVGSLIKHEAVEFYDNFIQVTNEGFFKLPKKVSTVGTLITDIANTYYKLEDARKTANLAVEELLVRERAEFDNHNGRVVTLNYVNGEVILQDPDLILRRSFNLPLPYFKMGRKPCLEDYTTFDFTLFEGENLQYVAKHKGTNPKMHSYVEMSSFVELERSLKKEFQKIDYLGLYKALYTANEFFHREEDIHARVECQIMPVIQVKRERIKSSTKVFHYVLKNRRILEDIKSKSSE